VTTPRLPARSLLALLPAALAALLLPREARADEIVYQDPATCERRTLRASEIVSETWTEIQYREKAKGPVKTIAANQVLDIRRSSEDSNVAALLNAISELDRGHLPEARDALHAITTGGYRISGETGEKRFVPFTEGDPTGGRKRPSWVSEYAHFFYAKALARLGMADKREEVLTEARLALDDQPVPGTELRSGGFLGRFKGGNSRWLPEAMLLNAQVLTALGQYDEASKVYDALYDASIQAQIGPRWAYEAKLGPGAIAQAQDKTVDAANSYASAADIMLLLLKNETRPCARREIGRYYSRARTKGAEVRLDAAVAHNSKAEFAALRSYIEKGTPEVLRKQFASDPALDVLIAGARDPYVQAVTQNALGMSYFSEGRFEEAILAFRVVTVAYFQVPEQPALALYHLAQSADGAAQAAKADAKPLYAAMKDQALETLRRDHASSPWAKK
jgi:tetratricopeptide (TPR) repeat protein